MTPQIRSSDSASAGGEPLMRQIRSSDCAPPEASR
jgi:hypothetical protein